MRRALLSFVALLVALFIGLVSCSDIQTPALDASADVTTLGPGQTAKITVLRHFQGGAFDDVTPQVEYTVYPRSIISVAPNGIVTPASDTGVATVTITEPDDTASAILHFTVVAARIVSIRLDPTPAIVLAPSQSRRFTATATLTDLTTEDVTNNVIWSSSNEAAAGVGNTLGTFGIVTAITEGDTTITATDAVSNRAANALVFVRGAAATLAAVAVTPNPATVAVGKTTPLTAGGVYSDGTTSDLTKTAAWSSTNPAVATVDNDGVVTGVAAGSVTITAAGPNGALKGSTALTVQ